MMRAQLDRLGVVMVAVFVKDLRVNWSYRASFVFGHAYALLGILVFYFVAPLVGQGDPVKSADYFQFAAVGTIVGAFVEASVHATVVSARSAQVQGTLEALAALPLTPASLGIGWLAYPLVEGLVSAALTTVLALPLGLWGIDVDPLALVVVIVVSVVIFGALGLIGTGIVIAFQQGGGVINLVVATGVLLSGTVFPVSVMPTWLEALSTLSPLRYSLDAMRATAIEGQGLGEIGADLLPLLGFAVVLVPVGVLALDAGFRSARRSGALAGF